MDKDPNNHFLTFLGNPYPHSKRVDPPARVPHLQVHHHEVLNRSLDMDPRPGLSLFPQGQFHKDPRDPRRVPQGISIHYRRLHSRNLSKHRLQVQGCTLDGVVLTVPRLRGYPTQITHLDPGPQQDHRWFHRVGHHRHLPRNQTILCMAIRPNRLKGE